MATGDTAVQLALSSPPPRVLDRSSSNISSPLSEFEDRDGEPDEMDLDLQNQSSSSLSNVNLDDEEDEDDEGALGAGEDDDELSVSNVVPTSPPGTPSIVGDVDPGDSEAETERLHETPHKPNNIHDVATVTPPSRRRTSIMARDRTFDPSPSKLKQQIHPGIGAEDESAGDESTSDREREEEGDDDNLSDASSNSGNDNQITSTDPTPKTKQAQAQVQQQDATVASQEALPLDGRKRKRSPASDQSDSDQPLRKRVGSVNPAQDKQKGDLDITGDHADDPSASGEHSSTENDHHTQDDQAVPSVESTEDGLRTRKSNRQGTKNQNDDEDSEGTKADTSNDNGTGIVEEDVDHGDNAVEPEIDEEVEAAHRDEDELERKRLAWDGLQKIEKHFNTFRERFYQERLDKLEEEEASLSGDNPTHPEYLAMVKCLDERRDEKIRIAELEFQFNMQTLNRSAVATRGQIHSQYYQAMRESREAVLEDLGQQWYNIQQQRRRHANPIPDFGIRLPASKVQRTKDAIAYNKEVSVLSGVAKFEGFPAAPAIRGASTTEVEDDFEEIHRARQEAHHSAAVPVAFQELSGLSFALGAAGQQYLADTPWANPQHPSHQLHRQKSLQEPRTTSPLAGSSNRRHSGQPGGIFSSSTNSTIAAGALNGESPIPNSHRVGQESTRTIKTGGEPAV